VNPGTYNLKFTKSGFAAGTISNIRVDVNKTLTYDLKLEISGGKEIVEVSATAQAELQTTDAQVGNEVSSADMMNLPTLRRNAAQINYTVRVIRFTRIRTSMPTSGSSTGSKSPHQNSTITALAARWADPFGATRPFSSLITRPGASPRSRCLLGSCRPLLCGQEY